MGRPSYQSSSSTIDNQVDRHASPDRVRLHALRKSHACLPHCPAGRYRGPDVGVSSAVRKTPAADPARTPRPVPLVRIRDENMLTGALMPWPTTHLRSSAPTAAWVTRAARRHRLRTAEVLDELTRQYLAPSRCRRPACRDRLRCRATACACACHESNGSRSIRVNRRGGESAVKKKGKGAKGPKKGGSKPC